VYVPREAPSTPGGLQRKKTLHRKKTAAQKNCGSKKLQRKKKHAVTAHRYRVSLVLERAEP
jgi:hypothetical protein